jgi:hypothetical protein
MPDGVAPEGYFHVTVGGDLSAGRPEDLSHRLKRIAPGARNNHEPNES